MPPSSGAHGLAQPVLPLTLESVDTFDADRVLQLLRPRSHVSRICLALARHGRTPYMRFHFRCLALQSIEESVT